MKQFIFPDLPKGEIVCAVYKMIFDDGSFYIGSAANLRQRMNGWRFKLNSGIDKNHKVTNAFKATDKVVFEILDVVDDPTLRKYREDGYIKINYGKPLCLNIASNAFNNKGVKQNPNKKVNKSHYQPVVKINNHGEIIERYASISEANAENNTRLISECFFNCLRKVKGMMFRKLDSDGNIVSAPMVERKPRQRKKGYKFSKEGRESMREKRIARMSLPDYNPLIPDHAKKIEKYNTDGKLVGSFLSISSAAKDINVDSRNFKRQIKKSPRNYYKGFVYKYA